MNPRNISCIILAMMAAYCFWAAFRALPINISNSMPAWYPDHWILIYEKYDFWWLPNISHSIAPKSWVNRNVVPLYSIVIYMTFIAFILLTTAVCLFPKDKVRNA